MKARSDLRGSRRPSAPAEASQSAAAIHIDGLQHSYAGRPHRVTVLNNINLEVHDGEFLALMGPSGCGKTTLLNLMAGFEAPTSGSIHCHGRRVLRPGVERGVVLQKPALYPWMNVLENVMFGLKATGRRKGAERKARDLLADVGLAGYDQHHVYELSGGMQHRVAIARTLATEPEVLLMDEPFGALDAQTRSELQAFLLDLWQRHRSTVVFVTHDIEEGLLLSDRVVVLGRGDEGVRDVVDVSIPRPRAYETVLTPEFIDLRRRLRESITQGTTTTAPALAESKAVRTAG